MYSMGNVCLLSPFVAHRLTILSSLPMICVCSASAAVLLLVMVLLSQHVQDAASRLAAAQASV
jgi:hypothetical protein